MWLKAGVMEDGGIVSTASGVPQGGTISPLLSNIYGHALDAVFEKEASHLGRLVRYADDVVVLCRNETDARAVFRWLQVRALVAVRIRARRVRTSRPFASGPPWSPRPSSCRGAMTLSSTSTFPAPTASLHS
jgi:hypothetical protein